MFDLLEKLTADRDWLVPAIAAVGVLWIVFLILMLKSRARLRNCFVFLLAIVATIALAGLLTYDRYPAILVGD